MSLTILQGDQLEQLRTLPDESVQCCVTSPPYWGLRNYGVPGQLGLEKTPQEYVEKLVAGFREVRRVLRKDGVLWLNLGDSYSQGSKGNSGELKEGQKQATNHGSHDTRRGALISPNRQGGTNGFCKQKDLIGIPWLVAFALRDDGWWLRSDIIWAKPNPMPESVRDRPTRSHEYIFLLTKSERYYYDADAIAEPGIADSEARLLRARSNGSKMANGSPGQTPQTTMRPRPNKQRGHSRRQDGFNDRWDQMEREEQCSGMRNKRDVWTISPAQYPEAHFATFPPDLIKPCILAGSRPRDTILDPFFGSGTTGLVAIELGRKCIGIELNPEYIELARERCEVTPGLAL